MLNVIMAWHESHDNELNLSCDVIAVKTLADYYILAAPLSQANVAEADAEKQFLG
jgi:hypothetical protein